MKPWLLLTLLTFALVGCGHTVSDSDIVGTWTSDPLDTNSSSVQKTIKLNATADHKFVLDVPGAKVTLKGDWVYTPDNKKVGFTPVTITVPSPAGGTTEMPIPDAIAKLQANNADPRIIAGVQQIAAEQFFDVSDDGKKLENNGAPKMVKSGS